VTERPYIVCTPTVLPAGIPGATVRWCSVCGATVWASPSGVVGIEDKGFVPICTPCAPGVLQGDGQLFIATSQRAELRAMGMTDADIDRTARAAQRWIEAT
jgi:hypothetical protein